MEDVPDGSSVPQSSIVLVTVHVERTVLLGWMEMCRPVTCTVTPQHCRPILVTLTMLRQPCCCARCVQEASHGSPYIILQHSPVECVSGGLLAQSFVFILVASASEASSARFRCSLKVAPRPHLDQYERPLHVSQPREAFQMSESTSAGTFSSREHIKIPESEILRLHMKMTCFCDRHALRGSYCS